MTLFMIVMRVLYILTGFVAFIAVLAVVFLEWEPTDRIVAGSAFIALMLAALSREAQAAEETCIK